MREDNPPPQGPRLSCHRFRANEVRLLLGVIAHNLGNLLRRLVLPVAIQNWSLTSLQQRLFKTGGRLIRHRSEEHTSELQSRLHLVCRLLLGKKKKKRLSSSY